MDSEDIYNFLSVIVITGLFITSIVLLFMGNYMPSLICAVLFVGTRMSEK